MSQTDLRFDMGEAVRDGIVNSQNSYERLSGGEWAWMAPEYWITTEVARRLGEVDPEQFNVTLESKVRDVLGFAGGIRRGRPSYASRIGGRFDAVVWNGEGFSVGIVEIKRQTSIESVRWDALRIAEVLKMRGEESTILFGVIGYYFSSRPVKNCSADSNVANRIDTLTDSVREWVGGDTPVKVWKEKRNAAGSDDSWGACSICIG